MKRILTIGFAAAAMAVMAEVKPQNYYGKIAKRLADMLPKYHVLQQDLDDSISRRAWTNLVTYYDYDRSVFLQSDLDRLSLRETKIDDELKAENVSFGFEVHNLYVQRLKERMLFATNLLKRAEWDFSADEDYLVKRKDAKWPATKEEAEAYWTKRMKNEVLVQYLAKELDAEDAARKKAKKGEQKESAEQEEKTEDKPSDTNAVSKADTPEESLIKKYRQYSTVLTEPDEEAVLQHYLGAVARAYDPHTDYMSPVVKEDFDMDMNLTLCGVGAVLSMEDGALKITEVMHGGPMDRDGRIKEGDKICGVKQADGPMEDVMWQPMKKSIKKIRGKKGTRVTLEIIPRSDPSGMTKKCVELVRDEIKLEDQAATGRVEFVESKGVTNRLGYVYLPGFYGTMDKRPNDPGYRSSAMDVGKFIAEFNSEDVEGMILDLRGDGGGSLREAVMLSALFVPDGPVVQIKQLNLRWGVPREEVGALPIPPGNPVAFKKPLVVMIDRASASASEIVAGHLQDTGRAIVVGDIRSHGKGTVQTVLPMGPEKYGSMKITTARFYRVNGRSTQLEGVMSDIHLPSLLDSLDIGEDKMDGALPFSRILPADYPVCWNLRKYLPDLSAASATRLKDDPRYLKHLENVAGMKEIGERKTVPLERAKRKAMMRRDRDLRELDEDDDEEKEEKVARRRRNQRAKDDVVLEEAWRILSDLVRLNRGAEIPVKQGGWL